MRIPLTRAQLNVWLADQLLPDAAVLGVPFILDVPARLDTDALSRAFRTLVNSADSLRTVIEQGHEGPVAAIAPRVPVPVEIIEAAGDPEAFLSRWLTERRARRFVLHERLFDAAIVVLGGTRTVWYLNQHHLITDGWSIRTIATHLATLYDRAVQGALPETVALPPYSDYVASASGREASPEYAEARDYWQARLAVPTERPPLYGRLSRADAQRSFRIMRTLDAPRSDAVRIAGRDVAPSSGDGARGEVSVFAAALAAWQSRVSGASTISVGIPYHNRPLPFRETLGLFANVVPLVVSIDPAESFAALLARVQSTLTDALRHAHYPLAHTLTTPLYHSIVNYRPEGRVVLAGHSVPIRLLFTGRQDGAVSLGISHERDGPFRLDFDLSGDVFPSGGVERAIHHFLACLDGCVDRRAARVGEVDLVPPDERAILLAWSRGDARSPGRDGGCLDWILRHATVSGSSAAVVDGDATLSYAELASYTHRLADHLRRHAVAAEVPVGIALERSAQAIVSVLGTWMAGGAYLPLDLDWPDERLAYVLADASVPVVVTASAHRDRVQRAAPPGCHVVVFDELEREGAPPRDVAVEVPSTPRAPGQLAYIIYTSGSTGRPKGVAVTDGSVANHAEACARLFALTPGDRVLQFRRLVFDGSVEEIFPTLVAGATLVLRPEAAASDFTVLSRFVAAHGITVLELPTSYWHEWVHFLTDSPESIPQGVRLLAVGGEEPSVKALADWRTMTGGSVRWLNMYGPTETTVTAAAFEATGPVGDRVPIGRPLDNVTAYVLDEGQRPVPIGAPGELCVGGAGVARGYVNRPDLTRERFVPDPFERGASRMYRTGDSVRYREEGVLEYLGRQDDQIKLRGYRIELAEIEQALQQHRGVARAAVLAGGDTARLIGFIVEASPVDDRDLRTHLRTQLPEYMVPSTFVRLDRLPLTAGGKIDRTTLKSLAVPRHERHEAESDVRNPVEAQIAAIWARVLGVSGVGRSDSFVELGGHSLLAARLVHELSQAFGRRLPLAVMFPDATVEKIADALREADADRLSRPIWTANLQGAAPPLVYFHGDYSGGGFYSAQLARLLGPEQPLMVVHPHGVDTTVVPPTIEEMARDRLPYILSALRPGPVLVGGYCNGGLLALETARLLDAAGHTVLGVVMLDATNDNARFQRVAAAVNRYARWRGLPALQTRDLLLRWFDRQTTLEQLLGLDGVPGRFSSVRQRLAFVAAVLKRKLLRLPSAEGTARRRTTTGVSRHDVLFDAYALATTAYVAQPFAGRVALIVSDDLPFETTVEQWAPVTRDVTTYRVSGDHRDAVTGQLESVAETVARIVAEYSARI